MAQICQKAADEFRDFTFKQGGLNKHNRQELLEYAFALVSKYGEAEGAAACQFYEEIAEAQGAMVPAAEMAELPEFSEVAKAVNGAFKTSEEVAAGAVQRLTKQVGADTILKNAARDGAQFAWVPSGDTCAFCITLASRGWQYMSKNTLKNGHAEHIHANCDCQYAVRFDGKSTIEGYDPQIYLDMYNNADPNGSPNDKINALRRLKTKEKLEMDLQRFAIVPDSKLVGYALNPNHAVGKNKARVFKAVLGYTQDNYEDLKKQILDKFDDNKLVYKYTNGHGKGYEQIIEVTGPNGNRAEVTTAWIKETDDSEARLVSVYIEV